MVNFVPWNYLESITLEETEQANIKTMVIVNQLPCTLSAEQVVFLAFIQAYSLDLFGVRASLTRVRVVLFFSIKLTFHVGSCPFQAVLVPWCSDLFLHVLFLAGPS